MSKTDIAERLLDAAVLHVPFDGWSDTALAAAAADCGIDPALTGAFYPRGGLDLVLAYHRRGDRQMAAALAARDLSALKFRERIALAVRLRLELADREAVRRGAALLSLPQNLPEGARALWETADTIWNALGDPSEDGNWYTKRTILAGVYSATALYWLGDTSPGQSDTWDFLDRRIEDVMRFETAKAKVRADPALSRLFALPLAMLDRARKPADTGANLPGRSGSAPSEKRAGP